MHVRVTILATTARVAVASRIEPPMKRESWLEVGLTKLGVFPGGGGMRPTMDCSPVPAADEAI